MLDMNQGTLEVIKQEMARMNIDILEISELKWTGMGEFNSDDYYIHFCGQESLRRNAVALIVNKKSLECNTWVQSKKQQNDLCSFPRQTIQYHSNPSLALTSNAEEAKVEQFYEDLQDLLELTPKRYPLHYWRLGCKCRKSRDTWSNRQIWPWSTK